MSPTHVCTLHLNEWTWTNLHTVNTHFVQLCDKIELAANESNTFPLETIRSDAELTVSSSGFEDGIISVGKWTQILDQVFSFTSRQMDARVCGHECANSVHVAKAYSFDLPREFSFSQCRLLFVRPKFVNLLLIDWLDNLVFFLNVVASTISVRRHGEMKRFAWLAFLYRWALEMEN